MDSSSDQQPPDKPAVQQVQPQATAAAKSILDTLNGKNFALSLGGASEQIARERAEEEIAAAVNLTLADAIRESTQDVDKELEKKAAAIKRLEGQLEPLQKDLGESQRSLQQKDHDLNELRSQVESLGEAKALVGSLHAENHSLKGKIADYETKENAKQAEHEDNEREYKRDRSRWESSERKLRDNLKAVEDALEARTKDVDTLGNNLKSAREHIKKVESLNEEYGKQLEGNGELIPTLENKVRALEAHCRDLAEKYQDVEGFSQSEAMERLERQFAAFKVDSETEMKETKERCQKEVNDLQHEIACLKDSKGRISPERSLNPVVDGASLADEMDDLESVGPDTERNKLEDLESQLEQMKKERDEAVKISNEAKEAVRKDGESKEEARRLRNEKQKLEEGMANLKSLNDQLKDKALRGGTSEENLQSQINQLKANLHEAEKVRNSLEKQRDHANKLAKTFDTENRMRLEQEDKMLDKIYRLQRELEGAKSQHETPPTPDASPSKSDNGISSSTAPSSTAPSSVGNSEAEAAWKAEKEELLNEISDLRSDVNTLEDSNKGLLESLQNSHKGPESHKVANPKSREKQLESLKQKYGILYQMYAVDLREQDNAMNSASKRVLAELAAVPVTREQWDARYSHAGENLENVKADLEILQTEGACDTLLEIAQRDVAQAEGAVKALQNIIHNIAGAVMLKRILPDEYVPSEAYQRLPAPLSRERPDIPQPPDRLNRSGAAERLSTRPPPMPAQLLDHPPPPPPPQPPQADMWSGLQVLYDSLPLNHYILMVLNVIALLALASSSIAEARKYACWRAANNLARAVYINQRSYLAIPFPHMSFFWELFWRS